MMFIPTLEQAEEIAQTFDTPTWITSQEILETQVQKMKSALAPIDGKIYYAIKANFSREIVSILKSAGIDGIDTVSPGEIDLALDLGFRPEELTFTGTSVRNDEMYYVESLGVIQNLGSLSEVRRFAELFQGKEVSLRICPEITAGENDKVSTGHTTSKFGIPKEDLEYARMILEQSGHTIIGLHIHIGSGFYDSQTFGDAVRILLQEARAFDDLHWIDLGGGFGVTYHPDATEIDLNAFVENVRLDIENFRNTVRPIEIRVEPGKFLVSHSTALLVRAVSVYTKGHTAFVGVDSGFNHLIRPTLYGSYHHIMNLSHPNAPLQKVKVVGNICESGDVFHESIEIPSPQEGDLLAILATGGYGASMSSDYNLRKRASEVVVYCDSV